MCKRLILDTDTSHFVLDDKPNRRRDHDLRTWIGIGYGILCYTTEGKLGKETAKTTNFKMKLEAWQARGRAFRVSAEKFVAARQSLEPHRLRSNDADVIALAMAGEVHILGTQDKRLKTDVQKIIPQITGKSLLLYPVDEGPDTRTKFLAENRCKVSGESVSGP